MWILLMFASDRWLIIYSRDDDNVMEARHPTRQLFMMLLNFCVPYADY
jgi:hypothetical protein